MTRFHQFWFNWWNLPKVPPSSSACGTRINELKVLGKSSLLHVTCGAFTLVVMSQEKQLSQVLMVYVNTQDKPQLMGRTDTDVHIALVYLKV